jgi:hypothetical protein
VIVLLVAVATLFGVLQWLSPPVAPTLVVLATENSSTVLPPNSPAAGDAVVLRSLQDLFEVAPTDAPPLTREHVSRILKVIAQTDPQPPLLARWKPTALIVYVNMIGVRWDEAQAGADRARAWLVPDDFDPDQDLDEQLVSVRQLMESISRSKATNKLVVLDCQRAAVHPHFGLATEQFVEAAREDLSELPDEAMRGVSVLFACGPGEFGWPLRGHKATAFGHFFSRGISGDADNGGNNDRRVTLEELAQYLVQEVNNWALLNCDSPQNPFLLNTSGAATFTLSVLGERQSPDASTAPPRTALSGELESAFQKAYAFARRPAPPGDWTPVPWAMVYHDLTAAERFYRMGNADEAARVLRRVESELQGVTATHRFLRSRTDDLSASGSRLLALCCADGWPEVPAVATAPADLVVAQVVEGLLSPVEADQALDQIARDSPDPLPPTAQWTRLVASRSRAGNSPDVALLRDVIAMRVHAEEVARPAHPLAGRWMRSSLQAADAARRNAEDRVLLQGWSPLAMGDPASATTGAREKYDEAASIKETVTRACRLRDRLLAELAYWIAYAGRTAGYSAAVEPSEAESSLAQPDVRPYEGMSFPETARRGVDVLLTEIQTLNEALLVDPDALSADDLSSQVDRIGQSAIAIESQLGRMEQEMAKYAGSLADDRIARDGGTTWRRIDDLLILPFPMADRTADADADARSASRLRGELRERLLAEFAPEDGRQPAPPASGPRDGSAETAKMYVRLYSLPLRTPLPAESDVGELLSGQLYRRLVSLAAAAGLPDLDRETAQRADIAFRLLRHGREADLSVASPATRLRVAALKDWLTWQAQRMSSDFYASVDQRRPPYFAGVSIDLLDDARRLRDVDRFLSSDDMRPIEMGVAENAGIGESLRMTEPEQAREQVDQLLTALDSAQLKAEPAELTFRGDAPEGLLVGLFDAARFPSGTAAVQVDSAAAIDADTSAARFLVSRPSADTDRAIVSAYFRGHVFTRDVPLSVIGEFSGPAVVYRRQNEGNGRIRFRANRVDQEPIHLLFVLDCSGSMGLPDSSGERRIDGLRRALTQFVEAVDGSNVRIGVRLFGRRVEDINAPEARTDTELAMPIGRLGVGTLEGVRGLLTATGHSPMFRALIDGRSDFGATGPGRRVLVLISDGADNWALAGEKPGLDELIDAYQGNGIQINTIGFHADNNADFAELRRIATAGDVEGRCVAVENAGDLLQEMAGLVGLPGYRILRDGQVERRESQFSSPANSIELPPGLYDVEILGAAGDVLTKRSVRILPADEHVFVYDSGTLRYATAPAQTARAVATGAPDQPDLLVFNAQSLGADFVVEFGLDQKSGSAADLFPVSARIAALSDGVREREWVCKHLSPNVADQHLPRWQVSLGDWPATANQVEVQVVWNDLASKRVPVPLDWDQQFAVKAAADNVNLVRRDREAVELDGASHTAVLLTFALSDRNSAIEDWAVTTTLPVVSVRQAYAREHGMYSVELVVSPNSELNEVTLFHTESAPAGRTLRAVAPISEKRINP